MDLLLVYGARNNLNIEKRQLQFMNQLVQQDAWQYGHILLQNDAKAIFLLNCKLPWTIYFLFFVKKAVKFWILICENQHSSNWLDLISFCCLCRRERLSWEDTLNLASFLGEQLRHLHLLPLPPFNYLIFSDIGKDLELTYTNSCMEVVPSKSNAPAEWEIFVRTLIRKKKDVASRLSKWYAYVLSHKNIYLQLLLTNNEEIPKLRGKDYCIRHLEPILDAETKSVFGFWRLSCWTILCPHNSLLDVQTSISSND